GAGGFAHRCAGGQRPRLAGPGRAAARERAGRSAGLIDVRRKGRSREAIPGPPSGSTHTALGGAPSDVGTAQPGSAIARAIDIDASAPPIAVAAITSLG